MPRRARVKSESGIYHLMLRGINRQNVFEEDEDRIRFLETIGIYKEISNYRLYGYCLMDNHIHMLLQETGETISQAVQRVSSSYVYWYNKKYERCGHLFQDRFKSEAVESDAYLLTVLRYIHNNPIKAGISSSLEDYRWSSYSEYIRTPRITDTDFVLGIFSENQVEANEAFNTFMNESNDDECLDYREISNIPDKVVIEHMSSLGIYSINELQHMDKELRNAILRKMKEKDGVSIRQLARVTGIAKSVIDRI